MWRIENEERETVEIEMVAAKKMLKTMVGVTTWSAVVSFVAWAEEVVVEVIVVVFDIVVLAEEKDQKVIGPVEKAVTVVVVLVLVVLVLVLVLVVVVGVVLVLVVVFVVVVVQETAMTTVKGMVTALGEGAEVVAETREEAVLLQVFPLHLEKSNTHHRRELVFEYSG
jgi:ABC-type multidrug transport system fused ATPase/permease subunit